LVDRFDLVGVDGDAANKAVTSRAAAARRQTFTVVKVGIERIDDKNFGRTNTSTAPPDRVRSIRRLLPCWPSPRPQRRGPRRPKSVPQAEDENQRRYLI
jgi:hypothetical protein